MKHCFVTGTGTDVGKTWILAFLLRALRQRGLNAAPMKPIQTGVVLSENASEFPDCDLRVHLHAAQMPLDLVRLDAMMPYSYEPACSPHLAGRLAGRYPDLSHIVTCARDLAGEFDVILAEGAGGVYAPIDEERTMIDLMKALGYPVVLVAHRGLGTINHTLLSIEAIRNAGLELLGVVFNETEDVEPDFIKRDNPDAVARFGNVPILGNFDFLGEASTIDGHAAAETFERCCAGLVALWTS